MLVLLLAMWPYVKVVDRCHVYLEHPPQAELDTLTATAQKRFGKTAKIDLNFLGSQVDSVELSPPLPMDKPPATALADSALANRAAAYIKVNADLFGIAGEVDQLAMTMRQLEPGVWQARGTLHRDLHGYKNDIWVNVVLTELGEIRFAGVNGDVPPEFPICDQPKLASDDARIVQAVVGKELWYDDLDGKVSFGKITKDEIVLVRPILASVTRMPPDEDNSNPHEYARGYAVYVRHMSKGKILQSDPTPTMVTWEFLVDGETGKQLGHWNLADWPVK